MTTGLTGDFRDQVKTEIIKRKAIGPVSVSPGPGLSVQYRVNIKHQLQTFGRISDIFQFKVFTPMMIYFR